MAQNHSQSNQFANPSNNSAVAFRKPADLDFSNYDYYEYFTNLSVYDFLSWPNDDKLYLTKTIVLVTAFVFGLIGNLFVIFIQITGRSSSRHSVTSVILASLAVSDIVLLSICVPYILLTKHLMYWPGGETMCKFTAFIEILVASSSALNLTAVSVERYAVIVHPVKSRAWCTRGKTKKFVLGVWTSAILISLPLLFVTELDRGVFYDSTRYITVQKCVERGANAIGGTLLAWYLLIFIFLLPLSVMTFSYVQVIAELWFSTKELTRLNQSEFNKEAENSSRERFSDSQTHKTDSFSVKRMNELRPARKQVIRMLLTIIALFFLCWGPKYLLSVLRSHFMIFMMGGALYLVMLGELLPFVHCCFNPLVYSFMSSNFRRSVRETFSRIASASNHHSASRTGIELEPLPAAHTAPAAPLAALN